MKEKTGYSLWNVCGKILILSFAILFFKWGGKLISYGSEISNYKKFQATAEMTGEAEGHVISVEKTDKRDTYKCSVRYVVDGKTYTYTISSYANEKPAIGEPVPIRYIPSNPSKAGINYTQFTITFINVVLIAGIVFILLAILFTILTIRNIVRIINPKKEPLEDMYN